MAKLLLPDKSTVELDQVTFDDSTNAFRLSDSGGKFGYEFQYALQKQEVEHEYELHLCYRKDVRNEEINEVFDRITGERIGWSFPVAALTTSEHSFADNEHFLRTAFGAYKKLLAVITIDEVRASDDQYLDKLLFLDPDTVIFCLFRTFIDEKIPNFSFRSYYPSLYRFGYTLQKTSTASSFEEPASGKIRLNQICKSLANETFIDEIFNRLVYETHPLARFVVLYQVIELCLDRILLKELTTLTDAIRRKDIYVRDIRLKLESFESEKKRINKLFNQYQPTKDESLRSQLLQVCKEFLNAIGHGVDDSMEFADTFYLVRNTILHNFRNITRGVQYLDQINDLFSHLVSDLVVTYEETAVN
jgi:hypothetical protein